MPVVRMTGQKPGIYKLDGTHHMVRETETRNRGTLSWHESQTNETKGAKVNMLHKIKQQMSNNETWT